MAIASAKERLLDQIFRECARSCVDTARWLRFGEPNHPGGTPQQQQLFAAVDSGAQYIAASSGKGIGKTAATGVVAVHKLFRGGVDCYIPVVAPKMEQGRDVWLKELRTVTLENAHPLLRRVIDVTRSKATLGGRADWAIVPKTAADPMRAQGIHGENLYIIFEEASGIERPMMEAYWSTLTNEGGGGLWIGNPNLRECFFFDCFYGPAAKRFVKLVFNAEESPLVSRAKILEARADHDRDSDYYRVNILGQFPRQSSRAIINLEDAQACAELDVYEHAIRPRGGPVPKVIGLDFARFGNCENAVAIRLGDALVQLERWSHTDPNDVIEHAFRMQMERGWSDQETLYVADAGGIGQGVMRRFYDAHKRVYEFTFGRTISDRECHDEQTLAWWGLGKKIKKKKVRLIGDTVLLEQLSTRHWREMTKEGKLRIESKEEYEKRSELPSPDRADAVVMAFYENSIAQGRATDDDEGDTRLGQALRGGR